MGKNQDKTQKLDECQMRCYSFVIISDHQLAVSESNPDIEMGFELREIMLQFQEHQRTSNQNLLIACENKHLQTATASLLISQCLLNTI